MDTQGIQDMQRRITAAGFPLGRIDGWWGEKSQAACRAYLRSLMPKVNPWPRGDAASLTAFYGRAGDENNLVSIVPPFPMFYGGKRIQTLRCHKKVSASLLRVLTAIGASYGQQRGVLEEAEDFGGCFNFRNKRGGTTLSVHAWGAAIDLDADDNTYRNHWPMQADMPLEIMECFAREGWVSAGAFWGYDAMHHEAVCR